MLQRVSVDELFPGNAESNAFDAHGETVPLRETLCFLAGLNALRDLPFRATRRPRAGHYRMEQ